MIIESDDEESASMMLIDQSIDLAMEEENMEEKSSKSSINSNGKIMDQEYVGFEGFSTTGGKDTSEDDDDSRAQIGFEKSKSKITEFAEMDPELYGLRRSGRGGIKKVLSVLCYRLPSL